MTQTGCDIPCIHSPQLGQIHIFCTEIAKQMLLQIARKMQLQKCFCNLLWEVLVVGGISYNVTRIGYKTKSPKKVKETIRRLKRLKIATPLGVV